MSKGPHGDMKQEGAEKRVSKPKASKRSAAPAPTSIKVADHISDCVLLKWDQLKIDEDRTHGQVCFRVNVLANADDIGI